ncbi:hypothetical protein ACFVZC_13810 [Streptomyces marokkonensis]|uniref:Lipoprotein n=1 Tax=Streptomyces marokkonensis TaxID=324855 RepID=A0ABW6Q5L8_9ACTN
MNRRPTLLAALALTATAALTLSACGSDDAPAKAGDEIAGADTDGKKTPPATTPPASADRPKITFPADAKNVFEGGKTGDPAKDAVLADSALSVNAVDEAILKGTTDTQALGFYNAEKALSSSIAYAQRYIDGNDTWAGVTRYFNRKATLSGEKKAYVTYCSDETKSHIKNRKTGKVDKSAASSDSYVLYNTALTKNAEGVWQTTDIVSKRGAKECQP